MLNRGRLTLPPRLPRASGRSACWCRRTALADASPLQRIWRDSEVASRHAVINPAISYEVYHRRRHRPGLIMSIAVDAGPTSDLDPFADEFLVDPFAALGELRDLGPLVHLPRYNIGAVARHSDVTAVLRGHQRFSSAAGVGIGDLTTKAYS